MSVVIFLNSKLKGSRVEIITRCLQSYKGAIRSTMASSSNSTPTHPSGSSTPGHDELTDYQSSEGHQTEDETEASSDSRKRLFSKELRHMLYGLGDDQNPYTESVDFLEDLVVEYIVETTQRAMDIGKTGKVQVEDVLHLTRKDPRKYARVKDLLTMNEELKKARKAFDEVKYAGVS